MCGIFCDIQLNLGPLICIEWASVSCLVMKANIPGV